MCQVLAPRTHCERELPFLRRELPSRHRALAVPRGPVRMTPYLHPPISRILSYCIFSPFLTMSPKEGLKKETERVGGGPCGQDPSSVFQERLAPFAPHMSLRSDKFGPRHLSPEGVFQALWLPLVGTDWLASQPSKKVKKKKKLHSIKMLTVKCLTVRALQDTDRSVSGGRQHVRQGDV